MNQKHFITSLIRLCIKNPKFFLLALLLGGLFYAYEFFYARNTMVFAGIPSSKEHFTRIFRNDAYMVGYSDSKNNPLWVVYKLTSPDKNAPHLKRPENFKSDWRNFGLVTHEDYTHSGYDRGHMAPNHAIALLYGKEAQRQTFLMTNITPQKSILNQNLWQFLEEIELYKFTNNAKELWVFTGPLFDRKIKYLKKTSPIEIPDAFYKIYIKIEQSGHIKTLSFIIPQTVKSNEKLETYIVSIDEVEKQSGFDFLKELDAQLEESVEAKKGVLNDWLATN